MGQHPSFWKVLTRRKPLSDEVGDGDSKLNRVLGLYDLTALGVGSTLGAGVYVLAGQIAKDQAGPSVMLSFAIAALASLLAGVCYAEFGARVPKAGSAYVYSYVCIGEFAAFVIGWNLILEYVIGTASVCRGISLYLDTLINDTLKTTFAEVAPMHMSFLGSYFDFFAFGLVVVFGVALAFGVETSAIANNFCTCLNLSILLFVIVAGAIKANFANWAVNAANATNVPQGTDVGRGGFFPFGVAGTMKGAATCFFGFVGFDCIATTGEEVRNPRKNIPRSILLSLLVIFLCYCGVSTVLTLMVPYYLQDANAPLPSAFQAVGWDFAMWIVAIGGLVGLLASLFGALFPLPRVMYSMAQDGLMFRFLGRIHPKYKVPVLGSILAAVMTALIAGLFDLAQLVSLLSIGTLLAYSVVAISITILRYMDNSGTFGTAETVLENGHVRNNGNAGNNGSRANGDGHNVSENSLLTSKGERTTLKAVLVQLFNIRRQQVPTALSTRIVGTLITLFCLLSMGIGLVFMQAFDALITNQLWVLVLLAVLVGLTALVLLCICLQPRETFSRVFRVPLVPIVPAISIFINIYLMLQLDAMTWLRFGIWMAIGIPMFVACWSMYDIKNPAKRHPDRVEFERILRTSGQPSPHASPRPPKAVGVLERNEASILVLQQNERSVKSLDEIMDMREVSDDLKQVKHRNGQICYVEDTKSDKSIESMPSGANSTSATVSPSHKSDTSEEEKSVIALLDDVLQTEDDFTTNLMEDPIILAYDRKISVDSEMVPSVTRSTTKATVHSDIDLPDADFNESNEHELISTSSDSGIDEFRERQRAASELVDEILSSPKLWLAMNSHHQKQLADSSGTKESSVDSVLFASRPEVNDTPKHLQSMESLLSTSSVEDPLHSTNFRNKLSRLITKPPEPKPHRDEESEKSRPQLRHSKSEADVQILVLQAIAGCNDDATTDGNLSINQAPSASKVPKPPKFDPVLFKTINSLSKPKERPGLNTLLRSEELPRPRPLAELRQLPSPKEEVPFKLKLEAILKRGPSYKTQMKPMVDLRRPKSLEPMRIEVASISDSTASPVSSHSNPTVHAATMQNVLRNHRSVGHRPDL